MSLAGRTVITRWGKDTRRWRVRIGLVAIVIAVIAGVVAGMTADWWLFLTTGACGLSGVGLLIPGRRT